MGRWWKRAAPDQRIGFAVVAMIGWAAIVIIKLTHHPHGSDWLFILAAPFYWAFFVLQIRRARSEKRAA